MCVFVGVLV